MSDAIQVFNHTEFGSIRTVADGGEVRFCAKDITSALGYTNGSKAVSDHCRGLTKRYPIVDSLGRTQNATFISEPDVFRLIVSSKLPTAQRFEAWVFEEVLPSIRRHGGYLTTEKVEEALLNPDTIIRLATNLKAEQEERRRLEAENAAMAPKALFADVVANSESLILVRELAHVLRQSGVEIGERRLFQWMRDNGYLEKHRNEPTQRCLELGLMRVVVGSYVGSDGRNMTTRTAKITGKGQQYFVEKFLAREKAVA